jgi:hypothetical protein
MIINEFSQDCDNHGMYLSLLGNLPWPSCLTIQNYDSWFKGIIAFKTRTWNNDQTFVHLTLRKQST